MTETQIVKFNRKVSMLYMREEGGTVTGIAEKFGISTQSAGKILTAARADKKVLAAVDMKRRQMNLFEHDSFNEAPVGLEHCPDGCD